MTIPRPRSRRATERLTVPALISGAVTLCGGDRVQGMVVDIGSASLGLVARGNDVEVALRHGTCCVRATVGLVVPRPGRPVKEARCQLVHVSPLRGHGPSSSAGARLGLRFLDATTFLETIRTLLGKA